MIWVLLALGILLAFTGTASVAGARTVGQMGLYRLIAARAEAAPAARALLSAPRRVTGVGLALAAIGVVLGGMVIPTAFDGVPLWLLLLGVPGVAVPLLLSLTYAFPRFVGRRWAEEVVGFSVPLLGRLAPVFAPLQPGVREERDSSKAMVQGQQSPSTHDTEELALVSGVLKFSERPVREVMKPRTEITAVSEGAPVAEVARVFADSRYSRIPVYRETLDDIVGMVYTFDLLKLNPGAELMVRPVVVVPGSKPCAELLFEMQRERRAMAVVVDEYGGTAGIATLQDLLEELVGETLDAVGPVSLPEVSLGNVIEILGTTPAKDVAADFEVQLPETAETVGGLLSRAAGRIPKTGERYELAGLEFDILAATATRVERVAVRRGGAPVVHLPEGGGA